jgi:hypothetical protein
MLNEMVEEFDKQPDYKYNMTSEATDMACLCMRIVRILALQTLHYTGYGIQCARQIAASVARVMAQ